MVSDAGYDFIKPHGAELKVETEEGMNYIYCTTSFIIRYLFLCYLFLIDTKNELMPKFIIERQIPGAGNLSAESLKAISQKSKQVLCTLGSDIQWIHSYVAGDKIFCIYLAPSEELIREHARQAGFPANSITEISNIIDLSTAE